jgi:hypothetical protein
LALASRIAACRCEVGSHQHLLLAAHFAPKND